MARDIFNRYDEATADDVFREAERRGKTIVLKQAAVNKLIRSYSFKNSKNGIIDLIIQEYGSDVQVSRPTKYELHINAKEQSVISRSNSISSTESYSAGNMKVTYNPELRNQYPITSSDKFRFAAMEYYEEVLVNQSKKREEETISYFIKAIPQLSNGNARNNVLHFMNGTPGENFDQAFQNAIKNEFDLENFYEVLYKELTMGTEEKTNIDATTKKFLGKPVANLQQALKGIDVMDSKQFVGWLIAIDKGIDKSQVGALKGASTFLEFIAAENLKLKQQIILNSNPNWTLSNARSIGSDIQSEYKDRLDSAKTLDEAYKIGGEIFTEITSDPKFKGGFASVAQKYISAGGSAEGKARGLEVIDIIFPIPGRDVLIDAKFGLNVKSGDASGTYRSGGRYTPSTGVTTSINKIFNSMFSQYTQRGALQEEFETKINILLNFLFFRLIENDGLKKDYEDNNALKFITYALLTSDEFLSHYRNINTGEQADFLATISGYVWYSDFFEVLIAALFSASSSIGSKVSFRMRYALDKSLREKFVKATKAINTSKSESAIEAAKKTLKKTKEKEMITNMLELLEVIGASQDLKDQFEKFSIHFITTDHLNLSIDVKDVTGKIDQMLQQKVRDSRK